MSIASTLLRNISLNLGQMRKRDNGKFMHSLTWRMVKVCEKNDSASCRVTSMGSSMMKSSGPPRWSWRGGMGDLANSWRMLVKSGFLKSHAFSLSEMPSSSMRTWLANDGLSSKSFFTLVSWLNIFLPLPLNLSSRKIYFWQDSVNARSARDKFLRFVSANGSLASYSTMETSRSSERRERSCVWDSVIAHICTHNFTHKVIRTTVTIHKNQW